MAMIISHGSSSIGFVVRNHGVATCPCDLTQLQISRITGQVEAKRPISAIART